MTYTTTFSVDKKDSLKKEFTSKASAVRYGKDIAEFISQIDGVVAYAVLDNNGKIVAEGSYYNRQAF